MARRKSQLATSRKSEKTPKKKSPQKHGAPTLASNQTIVSMFARQKSRTECNMKSADGDSDVEIIDAQESPYFTEKTDVKSKSLGMTLMSDSDNISSKGTAKKRLRLGSKKKVCSEVEIQISEPSEGSKRKAEETSNQITNKCARVDDAEQIPSENWARNNSEIYDTICAEDDPILYNTPESQTPAQNICRTDTDSPSLLEQENLSQVSQPPTLNTPNRSSQLDKRKASSSSCDTVTSGVDAKIGLQGDIMHADSTLSHSQPSVGTVDSAGDPSDVRTGADPYEENGEAFWVPYYLENFLLILDTVLSHDHDRVLFDKEDMNIINSFQTLSENGKKLYIRLFQRKLRWLRKGKIDYPKICVDLSPVLAELVTAAFLDEEDKMTELEDVLEAMTAPDLRNLAKSLRINTNGMPQKKLVQAVIAHSKQKTIGTLFSGNAANTAKMIFKRAKSLLGRCYQVRSGERLVFIRVMMLFSLTRTRGDQDERATGQQQLFQMLMTGIGRVVYPKYTIKRKTRIFPDRETFLRFSAALQWESDMADSLETADYENALSIYKSVRQLWDLCLKKKDIQRHVESLPTFLRSFTEGALYARILSQGVEVLQKQRNYGDAVTVLEELLSQSVYCQDHRGNWYDRLALNLDFHLKKPAAALKKIKSALNDPEVRVGHRLSLYQRAEKICNSPSNKELKKIWWKSFKNDPMAKVKEAPKIVIKGKQVQLSTGPCWVHVDEETQEKAFCSVEEYVILHYKQLGYNQGFHCEGGAFSFLFSLLLWDELFHSEDLEDVFQNAYQTSPLDLDTDHFYETRKQLLDAKLTQIHRASVEELQTLLSVSWEEHYGMLCTGVSWELFQSLEQAQGLVTCLGGAALSGIFRRLAKCHRFCRSGLPDLVMWNTDKASCKIVEVKGPSDHLSTKQVLWLDYLLSLELDAEVCHVSAIGAHRKR